MFTEDGGFKSFNASEQTSRNSKDRRLCHLNSISWERHARALRITLSLSKQWPKKWLICQIVGLLVFRSYSLQCERLELVGCLSESEKTDENTFISPFSNLI